jgi:hypothetical protein
MEFRIVRVHGFPQGTSSFRLRKAPKGYYLEQHSSRLADKIGLVAEKAPVLFIQASHDFVTPFLSQRVVPFSRFVSRYGSGGMGVKPCVIGMAADKTETVFDGVTAVWLFNQAA